MEPGEYKNIFENEASHFFYVTTRQLVISLVERFLKKPRTRIKLRILDAGCGTGLLTRELERFGDVIGTDIDSQALKFARGRGLKVKKASVSKLPFRGKSFGLLISIDVIYHRQVLDDQEALKEFFRVLKPNGLAIIRVPAHKWLKLAYDKVVHTRERYDKKEFAQKLINAGFILEKLSFVDMLLLPLVMIEHLREKILPPKVPTSAINPTPPIVNRLLIFLLSIEKHILTFGRLPFGLGLLAVCRRPKDSI